MIVFVNILPQQFIVEQIAGQYAQVAVMVRPGMSPHSYEPKASQMAELSRAKAYFSIGVEFEHAWIPRFADANPGLKIVGMDKNIQKIPMSSLEEIGHEHTPLSDEHDHGGLDTHVWLSPRLVRQMCATAAAAFRELEASHRHSRVYQKANDV